MDFVLNRDKTVASVFGHTIEFKKGVPTHVPPVMYSAVQAVGAVPTDEIPEENLPDTNEPSDPAERKAMIFDAFEKLVTANVRGDFMAAGQPQVPALKGVLGFTLDTKERDALWQEYLTKDAE